jgi:uncharacterized protein (DUF433 family)
MEIENYLDFLAPDDIRIKGSRIGIESLLYDYVYRQQSAEKIAANYPTLTLEAVYAAILYYLQNRSQMDTYLANWLAFAQEARKAQKRNPPPVVLQLQKLKAGREALEFA